MEAFQSGAMQGMTFGFGDEIIAGLMTPFEGVGQFKDGPTGGIFTEPPDAAAAYGQALEQSRAYDADVQEGHPVATTLGNLTGAVGTGLGLAKGGLTLMKGAAPTVLSMGGRGAAEGAIYGALHGAGTGEDWQDKIAEALKGAAVGGTLGGVTGGIGGWLANKSSQAAIPSVEDLKAQAGVFYQQAEQSGVIAPQQATQGISAKIRDIATANGLISPTGRVNSSYAPIAEVINTMDDFAKGTMTVPQMQAVRTVLTDAAGSPEKGIRRIAMQMLNAFDSFTDPLAPALAQGNQLWHTAMKGDLIETTIELAGSRAGQFSGSGFENALRTEFRALERQIIKGELRGLTQAEIDAITKVARGGSLENIARWIGKAAPTGVVSAGAGFGVPFAVGTALSGGNPGVGAMAGGATVGAGILGREAATAMTLNNARLAAALARSGGQALPPASPAIQSVMQALLAAEGSQAPKIPEAIRAMALN
jgi:hypothetical protein